MLKEYKLEIEQIVLHYDPLELERWRLGDPSLVPEKVLNGKGPGMANSYGYGEYFVQRNLTSKGHDVIANDYDIYSKKSKYRENNLLIEEALGQDNYSRLQSVLRNIANDGVKLEQPDLCIIKPELYFAEVKKGRDYLRNPQKVFSIVLWELLKVPFKVYKLVPYGKSYNISSLEGRAVLESDHFE